MKEEPSTEDYEARDRLCASMVTALSHSATFMANAIATSVMARRKAYVNKCPKSLVPEGSHEWLMLQPILPQTVQENHLFGNILPQLEKYALERKKLTNYNTPNIRNMSMRGRTVSNRGQGRGRIPIPRPSPSYTITHPTQIRGMGRGIMRARGSRSRYTGFRGKRSPPPPRPQRP